MIRSLGGNLTKRSKVVTLLIGSVATLVIAVGLAVGQDQLGVTYGIAGTSHHGLSGENAAGANGGNANGINSTNGPGTNGGIANGGDSVNRHNLNSTNTTRVHAPPSEVSFN